MINSSDSIIVVFLTPSVAKVEYIDKRNLFDRARFDLPPPPLGGPIPFCIKILRVHLSSGLPCPDVQTHSVPEKETFDVKVAVPSDSQMKLTKSKESRDFVNTHTR